MKKTGGWAGPWFTAPLPCQNLTHEWDFDNGCSTGLETSMRGLCRNLKGQTLWCSSHPEQFCYKLMRATWQNHTVSAIAVWEGLPQNKLCCHIGSYIVPKRNRSQTRSICNSWWIRIGQTYKRMFGEWPIAPFLQAPSCTFTTPGWFLQRPTESLIQVGGATWQITKSVRAHWEGQKMWQIWT